MATATKEPKQPKVERPAKPTREKIKFLNNKNEKLQLAAKARVLLGYKGLMRHVAPPGALAQALCALEIDPLNNIQVEAYKEKLLSSERTRIQAMPRRGYSYRTNVSWKEIPLDKYQKPVPMFVLNKAVQIAETLPTAEFTIEELSVTRSRIQLDPDPFLIVSYGDERYYVEVWDEPSFEAKH